MRVGIYNQKNYNGQYLPNLVAYEKILSHNSIPFVRLDTSQPDFWEQVASVDLFILRWAHYDSDRQRAHDLLPIIEKQLGVRCYPDWNTCWHYDDKIQQYLLMRAHGFPMVESYIFWERKPALQWVECAGFPVVFKLRCGAGSNNVALVRTRRQARRLVKKMFGRGIRPNTLLNLNSIRLKHFSLVRELRHIGGNLYRWRKGLDVTPYWATQKNYALFQKFLPGNEFDTRVTVIGDKAFAFRRSVRANDFRASGSGRIDHDPNGIDLRCVQIAHQVSEKTNFQSMAYDFLFTENNEPEFCEISYTYESGAVHKCPGYWGRDLDWHDGHFWPEHLHLIDALGIPDLRVPDLGE